MTLKQIQAIVDACLREPAERDGFPCSRKSEPEVRKVLKDFIEENTYPGEEFYRLAFEFHSEAGTVADQCGVLDRWKRAKGEPIEPIHLYCQLAEEGSVSKRALKENLEKGLKREPDDLRLLTSLRPRPGGGRLGAPPVLRPPAVQDVVIWKLEVFVGFPCHTVQASI